MGSFTSLNPEIASLYLMNYSSKSTIKVLTIVLIVLAVVFVGSIVAFIWFYRFKGKKAQAEFQSILADKRDSEREERMIPNSEVKRKDSEIRNLQSTESILTN